jgi:hypothetical protein
MLLVAHTIMRLTVWQRGVWRLLKEFGIRKKIRMRP